MNTANWLPELFLKKVENDEDWYLFSPSDVDLHSLCGPDFNKKYKKYCKMADCGELPNHKVMKAKELWKKMLRYQDLS